MSAVLDAITEQTTREHFSQVHRVSLEVGELCNVEVEALAFCFEVVMKGTIAEHASFRMTHICTMSPQFHRFEPRNVADASFNLRRIFSARTQDLRKEIGIICAESACLP